MDKLEKLIKATSKVKLLYVEDNEQARSATLNVLSEFFEDIYVAVDGEDGYEQFSKHKIDLVISDISMPKLDGLGMIEKIRETNKDVCILLLSAYSDIEYFKRSIELGVDGYLFKPLDIEQFLVVLKKIVEKVEVKNRLAENINFLKQYEAVTNENAMISKTDTKGIITYVNQMFCKYSQYTSEELIGKNQDIIRHKDNPPLMFQEMWQRTQIEKKIWQGIVRSRAKDGSSYYVDAVVKPILDLDGKLIEYITMLHDITEVMSPKKQLKDFLLTAKDPLIILIKIESIRDLENYYGLDFATTLDLDVADMLEKNIPLSLGLENFYALSDGNYAFVKDCRNRSNIEQMIESLKNFQKLINKVHIQIGTISYDVSILVCVSYENNVFENVKYGMNKLVKEKKDFLITNDIAQEIHESAQKNLAILNKVKIALENDNIVSYFQPIMDKEGEIYKYESLVRLVEDNGNIMSPFFFLDIAKQGHYYNQITSVVLKNSFDTLDKIDKAISINISALDIENEELREEMYMLLEAYSTKASQVTFELLEDEEMKDFELIKHFISKVKSYGVKIAIDDFGSGYSNYERLLDFQPDIIKIDGSLVKNIETSTYSRSIVKSILHFTQDQEIKVIAEYVENEKIFHILKDLGVDYFQGYYFGKPIPL